MVATYRCEDGPQSALACVAGKWEGAVPECKERTTERLGQREPKDLAPRIDRSFDNQDQTGASVALHLHSPVLILLLVTQYMEFV